MTMATSHQLYCSFCAKSQNEVKKLIANPAEDSYICEECVEQCTTILVTAPPQKKAAATNEKSPLPSPSSIKHYLDQHVIGQDHAKEVLSVAVYNHYKRLEHPIIEGVEIEKSNILMTGPTGTGKTALAQALAKMLDVPLVVADATSLTEAGFVGDDVESIIDRLLNAADYNVKKAERGIIFLDECDKKRSREATNTSNRDVSGEGVQQALLKLLEGSEIVRPGGSRKGGEVLRINTKNILFILAGAFVGLDRHIEQSLRESAGIGFTAQPPANTNGARKLSEMLDKIEPDHLIKFGLIPELVGRLPVITALDDLDEGQLVRVLTEPKNALIKQYVKMFQIDGVKLQFDPEALNAIARLARARKTNGRALRGVLESRLLRTQFRLPDLREQGAERIIIHAATITHGAEPEIIFRSRKAAS